MAGGGTKKGKVAKNRRSSGATNRLVHRSVANASRIRDQGDRAAIPNASRPVRGAASATRKLTRRFAISAAKSMTGDWWWASTLSWGGWLLGQAIAMGILADEERAARERQEIGAGDTDSGHVIGWHMALDLGVEDFMIEDSGVSHGPLSSARGWKAGYCMTSWRQGAMRGVAIRVIPTSEMVNRGGVLLAALFPITEDEAIVDATVKSSWTNQYATPTQVLQLPNAVERTATREFTITCAIPKDSWAGMYHRVGITGTEQVAISRGGAVPDISKHFPNSDGVFGGAPVLRFVLMYQNMAYEQATESETKYSADEATFRIEMSANVGLREKCTNLAGKWKVNAADEEIENTDYNLIRHRPIALTETFPTTTGSSQTTPKITVIDEFRGVTRTITRYTKRGGNIHFQPANNILAAMEI